MTQIPSGPIRGVLAAALTPLRDDLTIDTENLVAHYRWLLENGCDGIAPLGTTGEANSFTVEERLTVIRAMGEAGIPGEKMMIGTGCCAIPDTVRLTRAALDAGACSVLMLPPFYYKKVSDEGMYACFARAIDAVGDPGLRVYLYHFPQMTGLFIAHDVIARLIEDYPGVVVGIKDSSGDWANMKAMLDRFPGWGVFPGSERFLLDGLRAGAPGCISASTNLTAPMAADVSRNWQGPQADALQAKLTEVRSVLESVPTVPAMKAMLAAERGDPSWANVRPPFVKVDGALLAELRGRLDATSFRMARAA